VELSDTHTSRSSALGFLKKANLNSGMVFVLIILSALIAFEMFNYSTTDYALRDLLGDLKFAGIRWATILAVAFCGIDFAGIARLFTPEQGSEEPKEVWYLFGAWLLAATMNAILTWWGVSMAIVTHSVQSTAVMDAGTLTRVVPVFVAVMVWVIRILIIGSLSLAGDRLLWGKKTRRPAAVNNRNTGYSNVNRGVNTPVTAAPSPRPSVQRSMGSHNTNTYTRPEPRTSEPSRPEPSYHPVNSAPAPRPPAEDPSRRRL